MNNSAAKVGEIFREAGTAFNKLSEMTLMLQPMDGSPPGGKWSDAEVEMLRGCINRFAVELNKISQHIKDRTMRHLKSLLGMDSGKKPEASSSPQQPQQSPPQPDAAQESNILETDFDDTLVNIFSQAVANNDVKDEDIDDFLLRFDPIVSNSTPPNDIMTEDRTGQQPSSEFEDMKELTYDTTLQAVPSLINMLDADVNNAMPYPERRFHTESMADIGTLRAVSPLNFGLNIDGASRNFRELNYNYTSLVSREAHFSLRQAEDTWNSLPANRIMGVPMNSEGNFILYADSSGRYSPNNNVQAPNESVFTVNVRVNESQYTPQFDTVSSVQTHNILSPDSFSNYGLNIYPFGSVQARNDEQKSSSANMIRTNLFGNNLYSANPEPVTSVQAKNNFTSIRADTHKQALAHRICGCRKRDRARHRRVSLDTRRSAYPIISPADESTSEPSRARRTRSRGRHASHHKIDKPDKKNVTKKKATTKSSIKKESST